MKLTAWRIFKKRHRASAFTGEGARRYGGRWNSKGVAVVYTAQSASLATLEMLVHLQAEQLLAAYLLAPVSFDARFVETVKVDQLPRNWRSQAPELQEIGDAWIAENASAVLRVPSVVIEQEWNYLLNPAHPDFRRCRVGKTKRFQFDRRLKD